MKSILSILALVLTFSIANAQERGPRQQRSPEEFAKMQVERLTKELELNQTQQDSIKNFYLASATEQQEIFKNSGDNRENMRKVMQEFREKQTLKIKSFLNNEQIKKYDELLAKQRSQFGEQGQRRGQRPNNN